MGVGGGGGERGGRAGYLSPLPPHNTPKRIVPQLLEGVPPMQSKGVKTEKHRANRYGAARRKAITGLHQNSRHFKGGGLAEKGGVKVTKGGCEGRGKKTWKTADTFVITRKKAV